MNRRDFLRRGAGVLSGLGLAPLLLPNLVPVGDGHRLAAPARAGHPAGEPADDGLPPRTVGLRSLGGDFAFDPVGLRLEPGDRLTWLNMGDFHTTTAFHPENADLLPGDVPLRIPDGAEPWHSGMLGLGAGTEFTHTFEVPGVYDYFCQPHYSFGMVGRIVVPSSDGPVPAPRPASELNEASRNVMSDIEAIVGPAGRAYEWMARINGVPLLRAHGEAAASRASRLADAMAGDEALIGALEEAGKVDAVRAAMEQLVEGVASDVGYEALLGRADEAKAVLRSVRGGG